MSEGHTVPITELLHAVGRGDPAARDRLWRVVYDEIHKLASTQLARDPLGRQLQATTLVHEAYLRLFGTGAVAWSSSGHFFAAAARAIRCILVDEARRRGRHKRGRGRAGLPLSETLLAEGVAPAAAVEAGRCPDGVDRRPGSRGGGRPIQGSGDAQSPVVDLLALDEALTNLEQRDARKAEVVMLRFFSGLSIDEIGRALGLSARTVSSEWRFARAWLHRALSDS